MTDFELYLMSSEDVDRVVSSDELLSMGKRAASKFVSAGKPLNDSVQEFAKEASLNEEQTRRVVEHANKETFLSIFKSGYDKNINFPVADYNKINNSTTDRIEKIAASLCVSKGRYIPEQDIFPASEDEKSLTKVAASSNETNKKLLNTVDRLKLAKHDAQDAFESFKLALQKIKTACLSAKNEGEDVASIFYFIKEAGVNKRLAKLVNTSLGLQSPKDTDRELLTKVSDKLLNKLAKKQVNTDHELYKLAKSLQKECNQMLLEYKNMIDLENELKDLKKELGIGVHV